MENRITRLSVHYGRLTPTEAEVYVGVYPAELTSATQARGRLMGPSCPYAATVEIAYPLREFSREYASTGVPHVLTRAIIPEPNWWYPDCPFQYRGPVELWQSDQCCERIDVSLGLRVLRLGPRGFKLNGNPLSLRGIARHAATEDEARQWHDAGYNTLLADVGAAGRELWELADRFGFLVIDRIGNRSDVPRAAPLRTHPSCLGWLLDQSLLDDPLVRAALPFPADDKQGLGVELHRLPTEPLPVSVGFVACREDLLPALAGVPRIALTRRSFPPDELPGGDEILGTICIA